MPLDSVIKERKAVARHHIYNVNDNIELRDEMVKFADSLFECEACTACKECRAPVSGVGNVTSEIMFIGRNPGHEEDAKGLPFIGKGGQLLDSFIRWASLDRDKIYITNLVKCYTTDDRPPTKQEIRTCVDTWLKQELWKIKPKVVVTFGVEAAICMTGLELRDARMKLHQFTLLEPQMPILEPQTSQISIGTHKLMVLCCVHPGAPLHNPGYMKNFRDDAYFLRASFNKYTGLNHLLIDNGA